MRVFLELHLLLFLDKTLNSIYEVAWNTLQTANYTNKYFVRTTTTMVRVEIWDVENVSTFVNSIALNSHLIVSQITLKTDTNFHFKLLTHNTHTHTSFCLTYIENIMLSINKSHVMASKRQKETYNYVFLSLISDEDIWFQ